MPVGVYVRRAIFKVSSVPQATTRLSVRSGFVSAFVFDIAISALAKRGERLTRRLRLK